MTSTSSLPDSAKTVIDKKIHKYPPKFWKGLSVKLKACKDRQLKTQLRSTSHYVQLSKSKYWAEVDFAFIRPGYFRGQENKKVKGLYSIEKYTWSLIKKVMKDYIGKKFFIEHNDVEGEQIGVIKNTYSKIIDNIHWACAKVWIPESDYTKKYLDKWEDGLTPELSSGHYVMQRDKDKVLDMRPREISATVMGAVTNTRLLSIKRNIKAR